MTVFEIQNKNWSNYPINHAFLQQLIIKKMVEERIFSTHTILSNSLVQFLDQNVATGILIFPLKSKH